MNYQYTLHKVAINEWNDEPYFAMRNGDGEAFNLYEEDDMRAVYTMLRDYFEHGVISDDLVEMEEIESRWKYTFQAVAMAREYGAPAGYSDDRIANTIRKAAADGRIPGAHQSIDGSGEWWYPQRALETYLSRLTWRERRKLPSDRKIEFIMPDEPHGDPTSGRMLSHTLADGHEVSHKVGEVYYTLFLNDDDQICAVIDTDAYKLLGIPLPGQEVKRPDDRKAANALLKKYGYRWEKFDQDWLDDNDDFDREPGWYLFHGTGSKAREIGRGDEAVSQAFAEINRGAGVVADEKRKAQEEEIRQAQAGKERKRAIAAIRDQIMKNGTMPPVGAWPTGETLLDTHNIYGAGDSFVIAKDSIWYIRGNGMDGDDWSRNNLPGSIGWRIDFSEDTAAQLRQLAKAAV